MNIRAELKSLKDNYEQSLELYERTKKTQHYVIYQSGFRDYLSFIEQHRLRTSDVDHLVYSELPKASKVKEKKEEIQVPKRAYRKPGTYQKVKVIPQEQRALEWQQKIIAILREQDRALTLKEISTFCGLGKSQVYRYLDRLKKSGKVTDASAFSKNGKQKIWRIASPEHDPFSAI